MNIPNGRSQDPPCQNETIVEITKSKKQHH
jgi:hypothetical protein